jgi:hypothetical protein
LEIQLNKFIELNAGLSANDVTEIVANLKKLHVCYSLSKDLQGLRRKCDKLSLLCDRPITESRNCSKIEPIKVIIYLLPKGFKNFRKMARNHFNFLKIFTTNIECLFIEYEYDLNNLVNKFKTRLNKLKREQKNAKNKGKIQLSIYIFGHGNGTIISGGDPKGIVVTDLLYNIDISCAGFQGLPGHRVQVTLTMCHSKRYADRKDNNIDVVSLCKNGVQYTLLTKNYRRVYNLSLMLQTLESLLK